MNYLKGMVLFIVLLAHSVVVAQNELAVVDSLIEINQPNAARSHLTTIYKKAKSTNDSKLLIQAIPTFIYTLSPLEHTDRIKLYFELLNDVQHFPQPAKSLSRLYLTSQALLKGYKWFGNTHSVYADTLQLSDETEMNEFFYNQLIKVEGQLEELKKYPIEDYTSFFVDKNKITIKICQTLSDYIAYQLIYLYNSNKIYSHYLLKNSKTDKKEWYLATDQFADLTFTKDNLTTKTLKLYQFIEKNNQKKSSILSYAVLRRLNYLYQLFDNENQIHKAWQDQFDYFKKTSARSKFLFELVKNKYKKGKTYHFKTNPEVEKFIFKSLKRINKELKKIPESDYSHELKTLLKVIKEPRISFSLLNIYSDKQPIPFAVTYKNQKEYWIRIYKIIEYDPINHQGLKKSLIKNQLKLKRTVHLSLPNKGLFQERSSEQLLEELPIGNYYFVATNDTSSLRDKAMNDSIWNKSDVLHRQFAISPVSVNLTTYSGNLQLVVVHLHSGKPIEGAEVETFYYTLNRRSPKTLKNGKTNENGIFNAKIPRARYIDYIVRYKGVILDGSNYVYNYGEEKTHNRVKLFTDRSIYRPGQTVYLKGIVFQGKDNDYRVKAGKEVKVKLRDPSYQFIKEMTFKTNEFGSFNGSFQLPSSTQTGTFTVLPVKENSYQSLLSFKVEEYKRPTFEITLNKPKSKAQLEDTVTVSGLAKAFAGYPISDATVSYTVYRKWRKFWHFYYAPNSNSGDLIKKGEITSSGDGKFLINFFAATDPNATENAYYYYEVKVKVTDGSGETHEKTLTLTLNETGLSLQANLSNKKFTQDTVIAVPQVVNLAGIPQSGYKGKLKIYKVAKQQRFLKRLWDNTEYSSISDEVLTNQFPHMILHSFDSTTTQKKLVKTINFTSGDTLCISDILKQKQGNYQFYFQVITDEKDTLRLTENTVLIDVKSKAVPISSPIWSFLSDDVAHPGQEINFQLGTALKGARALVSIYSKNQLVSQKWIELGERYSTFYKVKEKDRGLTFETLLYFNGKFYTDTRRVTVPYEENKIHIKTKTFRDKLLPGEKEQWTFTIQNNEGDFSEAELLAAMYDASLDKFSPHSWYVWPYSNRFNYATINFAWNQKINTIHNGQYIRYDIRQLLQPAYLKYPYFFGVYMNRILYGGKPAAFDRRIVVTESVGINADALGGAEPRHQLIAGGTDLKQKKNKNKDKAVTNNNSEKDNRFSDIQPRENFSETAFFYPTIYGNDSNEYVVQFTLPESLTEWKLLLLAHTKDVKIGQLEKKVIAQKELMITANVPRFLRQGDVFDFSSKVINLTDKEQTVTVTLSYRDPFNSNIEEVTIEKEVIISTKETNTILWEGIEIEELQAFEYTITATNSSFSDGERNLLPVLSNRVLVTETDHILLKNAATVAHTFDAFVNQNSSTLDNKSFSVEYIDNLAWEAVMSLPYLNQYNDKSITTLINRFYSNQIAKNIVEEHPEIKTIFESWKINSPETLLSELEKNEELKMTILKETPWVLQAKSEAEQRRRIAQLFKVNQLADNEINMLRILKQRQNSDGGFSWFKNGASNIYLSTVVLTRIGELKNLGVHVGNMEEIASKTANYLAVQQVKEFKEFLSHGGEKEKYTASMNDIYWLYSLNFFNPQLTRDAQLLKEIIQLYEKNIKAKWMDLSLYGQALSGIYFHNKGDEKLPQLIYASLLDRAYKNTPIGMYWIENSGYLWYQNKIGVQAMVINFLKVKDAPKSVMNDARLWLIINKESNAWETGMNTANAVYAILSTGGDYLKETPQPVITIGDKKVAYTSTSTTDDIEVEWIPGIGQVKQKWTNSEVKPELGKITIQKSSEVPAVLNLYWQYTEDLSSIKASNNQSLQIEKRYLHLIPGKKEMKGIEQTQFEVGDKIQIELIVTVDRDLEFVHIKDLRPAGFESTQTLSGYHRNKRTNYYLSPRDAAMHFYIQHLPKGTYKFTYTVYAIHSGKFQGGTASVQSYYAPKFSGHSGVETIDIQQLKSK